MVRRVQQGRQAQNQQPAASEVGQRASSGGCWDQCHVGGVAVSRISRSARLEMVRHQVLPASKPSSRPTTAVGSRNRSRGRQSFTARALAAVQCRPHLHSLHPVRSHLRQIPRPLHSSQLRQRCLLAGRRVTRHSPQAAPQPAVWWLHLQQGQLQHRRQVQVLVMQLGWVAHRLPYLAWVDHR
jgi:hypothetical protein